MSKLTCMGYGYGTWPPQHWSLRTEAGIKKSLAETRHGRDKPSAHFARGKMDVFNKQHDMRALASWLLLDDDVI